MTDITNLTYSDLTDREKACLRAGWLYGTHWQSRVDAEMKMLESEAKKLAEQDQEAGIPSRLDTRQLEEVLADIDEAITAEILAGRAVPRPPGKDEPLLAAGMHLVKGWRLLGEGDG